MFYEKNDRTLIELMVHVRKYKPRSRSTYYEQHSRLSQYILFTTLLQYLKFNKTWWKKTFKDKWFNSKCCTYRIARHSEILPMMSVVTRLYQWDIANDVNGHKTMPAR